MDSLYPINPIYILMDPLRYLNMEDKKKAREYKAQ